MDGSFCHLSVISSIQKQQRIGQSEIRFAVPAVTYWEIASFFQVSIFSSRKWGGSDDNSLNLLVRVGADKLRGSSL